MKHYIQHTVALFAILFSTLTATAQTQTTHEVQRGETLETVAQKYGITTEALLQANPDAADMFFTGMKLQIPAAATTATSTTTTATSTTTTVQQSVAPTSASTSAETTRGTVLNNKREGFNIAGLAYYAGSFEDVKATGHYGVTFDAFNIGGSLFGASVTVASFNYGLVGKDYTDDMALFGPNISYEVTKNVILALPVQCMCVVSFPKDEKGHSKTQTDWGWVASPRVYFRAGNFFPSAGLFVNGGFRKGEKATCGFMVGLSYNLGSNS